MATDDDWMEMSRNDDAMVADMLLRLRNAVPPPRPSSALRLVWTVRQRRSGYRKDDDEKKGQKGMESTRASPSTPLSFSAATSTSCGAAGEYPEESSRRPTRSKVASLKVGGNPKKRAKKKKTLVELKFEEDELLKEKRSLKNELTILHQRLQNERVKNEFFRRRKVGSYDSDEPQSFVLISFPLQLDLQQGGVDSEVQNDQVETVCELPDLNLPFEPQHHYSCAAEGIC